MAKLSSLALAAAVAAGLLFVADRLVNPVPIPAVGVIVGGLIGLSMRKGSLWLAISGSTGCLIGAAIHVYSHLAEGRVRSASQLLSHVLGDTGVGILIGTAVLGAVIATNWLVRRSQSQDTAV